jgi:hypothetical protein
MSSEASPGGGEGVSPASGCCLGRAHSAPCSSRLRSSRAVLPATRRPQERLRVRGVKLRLPVAVPFILKEMAASFG